MRNKHGNALKGIFYIIIVSIIMVTVVYFLLNQQGDEIDSSPTVVYGDRQIDLLESYIVSFDEPNYVTVEDYYKIEEKVRRLKWKRKYNHIQKVYEEKEKQRQLAMVKEEKENARLQVLADEKKNSGNWRTFHATAYVSNCIGCSGFTYRGLDVRNTIYTPKGNRVIAVDPNVIELGSLVKVRYGNTQFIAKASDIGSAINQKEVDILMSSKRKAYEFGRRKVQIEILN